MKSKIRKRDWVYGFLLDGRVSKVIASLYLFIYFCVLLKAQLTAFAMSGSWTDRRLVKTCIHS